MTLTLNLGVVELPYAPETPAPRRLPKSRPGKQRPRKTAAKSAASTDTGKVANILEARYHIMDTFFRLNQEKIADLLATSVRNQIVNVFAGAPPQANPFAEGEQAINAMFKEFIEQERMPPTGEPWPVPTRAALMGVNHRLKLKKGAPRPSFRDTGTYEAAFRAGVSKQG